MTLPLLVYAPNGADPHVEEITLEVGDPTSVDSLYVKAHQPFYHRGGNEKGQHEGFDVEGAASIQINNGPWIDVRNENIDCARAEENHVRCLGGVFSTVRFTIPASNVTSGTNWVRFRYNGTDGVRSGYRVLGVGFMRAADPPVETFDPQTHGAHDASLLQYDDFSSWGPPSGYDSPSDVSAGEQWFKSAQLTELPNGATIQASCSDCHARDGRDLKYFNYSNRTIVARSRFHGLSKEQGKQIAAYIRSIQLEKRDGSTYEAPGTPWDPPYQPGPELQATGMHPDASNQVYWAAGAGLEWVLNKDQEMLPYLFPNGQGGVDYYQTRNGQQALNWRHVHMDSTLNMRELPVSIQFPDWNNWLPDVHPKDAFPSQWDQSGAKSTYQNGLRSALQNYSEGFNQQELKKIENEIQTLHLGARSIKNADNETGLPENKYFLSRLSSFQWLAVKVWESIHKYHLEDVADEMYGSDPKKPFTEPRSWIGQQRTVFDIGPHISLPHFGGGNPPYLYGSHRMDAVVTHQWYQLQATINPGAKPGSNTQEPVDWNYQYSFLKAAPNAGMRMVASLVKSNQILSNGYGVDGTGGNGFDPTGFVRGWEPFTANPERFMRLRGAGEYSNLPSELREDLYTATLRAWNDFNTRFPIDEFPRDYDDRRYNPSDYVPQGSGATSTKDHAQKIYQGLIWTDDHFPEAYGAMDTLASWGAKMWPTTDGPTWDELVDYSPPGEGTPPSLVLTSPSPNTLVTGPDVTLSATVSDPDGTSGSVEFYLGGTLLGSADSPPYEIEWTDVPLGTYRVHARARDDQNLTDRDTLTFTVGPNSQPSISDNGLYYKYIEGKWFYVPDIKSALPINNGTTSSFDISVSLKSSNYAIYFSGYIDIPTDGVYTFYTISDEGSTLSINGQEIVDNDGRHQARERSGDIFLQAGRHFIEVGYFDRASGDRLSVLWSGPNISKSPIPEERLYLSAPTASISLHEGWNLISSPVAPHDPDLEEVLRPIMADMAIMKSGKGDTFLPESNINTIGTWDSKEGYKIYSKKQSTLSLTGRYIDAGSTISLNKGWNIVTYLPSSKMSPSQAFQSISDHLVVVKDEGGHVFIPTHNINDIGQLSPGQGYYVYVDDPVDLKYPNSPQ